MVHQMEVELIHFQKGHHVELPLDKLHRLEIAAHVEHHPPMTEPREIKNLAAMDLRRDKVHHIDRLEGIENSFLIRGLNTHALRSQLKIIG